MPYSCGYTSAGRAGKATVLALLTLLLATPSLQSGLAGAFGAPAPTLAAAAPAATGAAIPLSLGFGPSSLSPVSDGVPVYTVGDTIWAASGYNNSISVVLSSPSRPGVGGGGGGGGSIPGKIFQTVTLFPQAITPLHSFTASDPDGNWSLSIAGQGTGPVQIRFVNLASHPVSLGPLQYSLNTDNMSISAQASLGDSYDQEVCAGTSTGRSVSVGLPSNMQDAGRVTLIPGNQFKVVTTGVVNESTSFWFELYHPYALDISRANSVVVKDLMAAASQPVTIVTNTEANSTVNWNLPLRAGRYDLRTFFQNSTSLDVFQSRLLILNSSSWVSLSNCRSVAIQSQSVSYTTSLTPAPDNWPRTLYVMYRTFGVESVASFPVKANLSSVSFVASPWNLPMQNIKVNVSPVPGLVQTTQAGNNLFVLASKYPLQLNYSLDIGGGHNLAQGTAPVYARYEADTQNIDMAELTLHVTTADRSLPTTIAVTGPPGLDMTATTSSSSGPIAGNQTMSFLLPTGSYTVSASQGGNSQSAHVDLTNGVATTVSINLGTFPALEIILVITAAIAAIANVVVWVVRPRSLGSRRGPVRLALPRAWNSAPGRGDTTSLTRARRRTQP